MRRRPVLAVCALGAVALASLAACSDDPTSNVAIDANCRETTVSAPATSPDGPQFCGIGRYLTTEADTGEDQDMSGDYVSMAFAWRDAKGVTFVVTAGPPIVDSVFDIGEAVRLGIEVTDNSCTSPPPSTGLAAFTTTATNGACAAMQKVAPNSGPLTYTVEVRKGDTVVDTLTVDIAYAAG